jgi:two-component system NtrC family sensor kinase
MKDATELRKQAEARLRIAPLQTGSAEEMQKVLHELRVHQIELEMQNEELRRAQTELDAARARYFDLYDLAPVGYLTVSDTGLIVEVNLTAVTLLGAAKSGLVARPFAQFIVPADQDLYYLFHRQLLETGQRLVCGDLQIVKGDGTRFWGQLQGSTTTNATGATVFHLILSDTTARRQIEEQSRQNFEQSEQSRSALLGVLEDQRRAEEKLARLHAQYKLILSSTAEGIIGLDLQGHHTFVNPAAAKLLGYEPEELIGRESHGIWHHTKADDSPYPKEECKIYTTYQDGKLHHSFDEVFWRKDGTSFPVEYDSMPIYTEGRIVGAVVTFADITARQRAEAELRLRSSALNAAANAIVITDPTGNVVWANPAFTALTGYAAVEVLGKNPRILKSGQHSPAFYQQMWETIDEGKVWQGELVNKRKDGSLYTEEMTITPVRNERGAIINFIAIKQDITARKAAEEELSRSHRQLVETLAELRRAQDQAIQQASLRAMGQMAAGIAHDFNNALAPINGFSELLLNHPENLADTKKVGEYLQIINVAGNDAAGVVRRLREFGRQRETGETTTALDLPGLVRQTIEMTQPRWKNEVRAAGLTIHIATDLRKVPPIVGEEYALRELLTNLIFNAVDAMPAGGTITLGTARDGEFVCLWIRDTGIGMTAAVREHCFEPFFTTKGDKGTGLGLAMVYGIVKRHEGKIEIETELGRGTTFTIRLPVQREQPESFVPSGVPVALTRKLHVLVVDDEPLVRDITEAFLISDGHTVETAKDGVMGLERFRAGRFDAVITDKAMPGINGEQLAVAISALAPGMPVILMSGFGDLMKTKVEKPPHIREILSKPFTLPMMRATLARALAAGQDGGEK